MGVAFLSLREGAAVPSGVAQRGVKEVDGGKSALKGSQGEAHPFSRAWAKKGTSKKKETAINAEVESRGREGGGLAGGVDLAAFESDPLSKGDQAARRGRQEFLENSARRGVYPLEGNSSGERGGSSDLHDGWRKEKGGR